MSDTPETVGYWALIRRNADFRNLFAGRVVSLFGDWFNLLAILAMLRAFGDDSATGFALILILKTLPAILTPAAGVLADRLPRRNLMVFADASRAVVVLGMAGLYFFPSVPLLYVLVVVQTLLSSVFEPARNALFPDIVRPEELTAANALTAASWSSMLALGSAAGGLVTEQLGWQLALLLDAGTYLLSAVFLLRVREPEVERMASVGTGGLLDTLGITDLIWGARWMLSRPRVWTVALIKPSWQLTGARTLVLTLLGETAFAIPGQASLSVAALYIARGLGTGAGPFVSRWLTASRPVAMERAILVAFVVAGVCYMLVGFAPVLAVAVALLVVAHLGGATVWVFSMIRLQQLTPSPVRGRVFAAEHAAFTLVMAASTGFFGQLDDQAGPWLAGFLDPVFPGADPAGLSARVLAILLGLTSFIPFAIWGVRGLVLGWGGERETLHR